MNLNTDAMVKYSYSVGNWDYKTLNKLSQYEFTGVDLGRILYISSQDEVLMRMNQQTVIYDANNYKIIRILDIEKEFWDATYSPNKSALL